MSCNLSVPSDSEFFVIADKLAVNAEAYLVTRRSVACSATSPRSTRTGGQHARGRKPPLLDRMPKYYPRPSGHELSFATPLR